MKIGLLAAIVFVAFALCSFQRATAGTVILKSSTWDRICKVEVITGMNAPEKGPRSSYDSVSKGTITTATDKLCYRRSREPGNCKSALNEWTCCSKLTSGSDTCSLR